MTSPPININSTNPCYIDTANNKIWMRLPHFSGTGPSVTGRTITAATAPATTSSPSAGGSNGMAAGYWSNTYSENKQELSEMGSVTRDLTAKQRIRLKVKGEEHHVGIINLTSTSAVVNVSSMSQQRTLRVSEEWKVDVNGNDSQYELLVKLNSLANNKANITVISISEELPQKTISDSNSEETVAQEEQTSEVSDEDNSYWGWIVLVIAALIVLGVIYRRKFR